ncbi:MAG: hypothetical protein ABWW69_00745 [Pyrodictiaceae archaeon]
MRNVSNLYGLAGTFNNIFIETPGNYVLVKTFKLVLGKGDAWVSCLFAFLTHAPLPCHSVGDAARGCPLVFFAGSLRI